LVPTFATLHSLPTTPNPSPVEITAALAVPLRIIPTTSVHTLRDIGLLLVKVHVAGAAPSNIPPRLGCQRQCIGSHGGSFPVKRNQRLDVEDEPGGGSCGESSDWEPKNPQETPLPSACCPRPTLHRRCCRKSRPYT